ncbi:MAG: hypothetical protein U9N04_00915 [Patescibacteria group bacterium]|nr:hypothetical protein [Patescibacteria group bacterium]
MQIKKIIAGTSVIALSLSMTSVALAATDSDGVNLSVIVAENMTLDCGADVDIDGGGSLTAGTPESNSTTCTITTNDEDGYDLSVVNDFASGTVLRNSNGSGSDWEIADYAGTIATPTTWTGTGLGFSVFAAPDKEVKWGTGTTCHAAGNAYAAFPDSDTVITNVADYSNSETTIDICYRVDVPSTQASGEYAGSVTYTATGTL